MNACSRTRRFYLVTLAARTGGFCVLIFYALAAPERFFADLALPPFSITPLSILWLLLMLSMVFRLFPSKIESLGCQKEFARRFRPTNHAPDDATRALANQGAIRVLVFWWGINALFYLGFWRGWLDARFMVVLAGFYGVCDIVCILFFCPFQSWMMHNRCCTTCRIYNWDYWMLCTPLLVIGGFYARSACLLSALLFLRWELSYHLHGERFFECSNDALRCSACSEHLCRYKRSIAAVFRRQR